MESEDNVTEMLEVPGHFQKPHEIFISEQTDWSFENSAQEETDPLCIEEEEDCENTGGGEEGPTAPQPVRTNLAIKEELYDLPSANLPPSDFTSVEEKFGSSSHGHPVAEHHSSLPRSSDWMDTI